MKAIFSIVGLLIRVVVGNTNVETVYNLSEPEIRMRSVPQYNRPSISTSEIDMSPIKNEIYDNLDIRESFREKRRPEFSPWGSKRVDSSTNYRPAIRVPFNSWGGKRNGITGHNTKRGRFLVNWNGKKVIIDSLEEKRMAESYKNDRRVPFNSWGGKRSDLDNNLQGLRLNEVWTERTKNDSDLDDQRYGSSNFVSWRVKTRQRENEESDQNKSTNGMF